MLVQMLRTMIMRLSTELRDVREEISDINTKLIKVQSYT
jgi:hypothetical protein